MSNGPATRHKYRKEDILEPIRDSGAIAEQYTR